MENLKWVKGSSPLDRIERLTIQGIDFDILNYNVNGKFGYTIRGQGSERMGFIKASSFEEAKRRLGEAALKYVSNI